jgi:hypothetical protein
MKQIIISPAEISKCSPEAVNNMLLYMNTELTQTQAEVHNNCLSYKVMVKVDPKNKTYDYPNAKPFSLPLLFAAIEEANKITLWKLSLVEVDTHPACTNYFVRFTASKTKTKQKTAKVISATPPLDAIATTWNLEPNQVCIKKIIAIINDRISAWKAPDMQGEPLRSPGDIHINARVYLVKDHLRSHSPIDVLTAFDQFKQTGWKITPGFDREVEDGYYYEFSYNAHT